VARDGIEPPTPAFSGPRSASSILLKLNNRSKLLPLKSWLQLQPNATIGSFGFAQRKSNSFVFQLIVQNEGGRHPVPGCKSEFEKHRHTASLVL